MSSKKQGQRRQRMPVHGELLQWYEGQQNVPSCSLEQTTCKMLGSTIKNLFLDWFYIEALGLHAIKESYWNFVILYEYPTIIPTLFFSGHSFLLLPLAER